MCVEMRPVPGILLAWDGNVVRSDLTRLLRAELLAEMFCVRHYSKHHARAHIVTLVW